MQYFVTPDLVLYVERARISVQSRQHFWCLFFDAREEGHKSVQATFALSPYYLVPISVTNGTLFARKSNMDHWYKN